MSVFVVGVVFGESVLHGGGAPVVDVGGGSPDLYKCRRIEEGVFLPVSSGADVVFLHIGVERGGVAGGAVCLFKDFLAPLGCCSQPALFQIGTRYRL